MESYAVGVMDECSMMVIIHTDLHCVLTAPSMTRTTSLTPISLVNFLSDLMFAFSLKTNRQDDIKFISHLSTWLGVSNFCMASTTVTHVRTNYNILQFGHRYQENANMWQNRYTNCFSKICIIKIDMCLFIPLEFHELSPFLCQNPIPVW